MNPAQPPAEPPRDPWADTAPALPSEPTHPNLAPQTPPGGEDNVAWPARYRAQSDSLLEQPRRKWWSAGRFRQIVLFALSVLETLLVIRFFLKLLGANPDAAFTVFMYSITELFVAPFEGVFPSPGTRGSVLDFATLLAMIVYALLAWLIISAVETLASRRPTRLT
jgi:uncharacterized protein YggT (Ycf19 family)